VQDVLLYMLIAILSSVNASTSHFNYIKIINLRKIYFAKSVKIRNNLLRIKLKSME
jgi:hypothetical protein